MSSREELVSRAVEYAKGNGLVLGKELGFGVHGIVFLAESQSEAGGIAIKIHNQDAPYRRERDIYLRLQAAGVKKIRGCHVPQLRHFDDELLVIDMTVVTRPYVLDFAGAYLDKPPEFSEEVMADWRADKQEQFGARWREVEAILRALVMHGIFMEDVSPSNIALLE